jgi:hypothetical protein
VAIDLPKALTGPFPGRGVGSAAPPAATPPKAVPADGVVPGKLDAARRRPEAVVAVAASPVRRRTAAAETRPESVGASFGADGDQNEITLLGIAVG